MKEPTLFRREALDARRERWLGDIRLRLCCTAVLLLAGCLGKDARPEANTPETVEIEAGAWPAADSIRWPAGSGGRVTVYFSDASLARGLGFDDSEVQRLAEKRSTLLLGEHDGKLVALLRDPALSARDLRRFVAAHEAFHVAAQFYGLRVSAAMIEASPVANPGAVDGFWDSVLALARGDVSCAASRERFLALSPADRRHVLSRAFWEWPAEYYARRVVLGNAPEEDYLALRSRIASGKEYVAGGLALWSLPSRGPDDWRNRVAGGQNPVNVLFEGTGCAPVSELPVFGRVSRLPLLGHQD